MRGLFERYKTLAENPVSLTDEQRALVDHEVRDFRLSGVELEGAARERYAEIQDALAEAQSKFGRIIFCKQKRRIIKFNFAEVNYPVGAVN